MGEPVEFWAVLASAIGLLGMLTKLVMRRGVFCVTPCGGHLCVIDTQSKPEHMRRWIAHMEATHGNLDESGQVRTEELTTE